MDITSPSENKRSPVHDSVVFNIIGKQKFQNDLMAAYLKTKTGQPCYIFKTLNGLTTNHEKSRIVMIDCQNIFPKHMLIELKAYNRRRPLNNHIVLFNVPSDMAFQKKLIHQGIHGFFYEHDSADILIKGLLAVIEGKLWFTRELMSQCIMEDSREKKTSKSMVHKLSPRQTEILSMIAIGASNHEISEKLFISPHTVKNHLYHIFKKIRVSNRIQASLWAAANL